MISPGLAIFKMAYQLSPIILTGGIAESLGGYLPIIALTEVANFTVALLSGNFNTDLDEFFANYQPLPGATLIDQEIAMYPFANQAVAANAVIAQPLTISLAMICPARGEVGYLTKLITMSMLQAKLAQHNFQGGTYSIVTPSYIYTNCIMKGMRDISSGETRQTQVTWQLDFVQPLVTQQQANLFVQAQNTLMNQLGSGLPSGSTPAFSGGPTQSIFAGGGGAAGTLDPSVATGQPFGADAP